MAFLPLLLSIFSLLRFNAFALNPDSRDLRIINEAGFKCNIYWINRWKNDELVLNSEEGVFHGAETNINSYLGHEFEVQEVPSKKTGHCKGPDNTCRKGQFKVNPNDEQLVVLEEGLERIVHTDNVTKARDQAKRVLQECKAGAIEQFDDQDPDANMIALLSCLDTSIEEAVKEKKNEIEFQENLRMNMGSKLAGYSCVDPNVTMSEISENKTWTDPSHKRQKAMMLFDKPTIKIVYVKDFATQAECKHVEEAVGTLVDVNGEDGLYAKKGSIPVPSNGDIAALAKRMRILASQILNVRDDVMKSEEVSMIHYEENKQDPRRYDAHCDGICDGSDRQNGGYIASVLVYCETANSGGHTHFSNSGIHVIPEVGSAIMYSYLDPLSSKHDTGFSKITECGVLEGDQKVISHKIKA